MSKTNHIEEIDVEELLDTSTQVAKVISTELSKFDPFENRIAELKEQYAGLTIINLEDKEGYENVRLAIGELRSIRTGTTKDKAVIKKPFLDACASIEEKSKWIIAEVSKIEDPLQKRKDEIDEEKEKIKREKYAEQEKLFIQRSMELSNMGAIFDGTHFVLDEVRHEGAAIRELDEAGWKEYVLPKFNDAFVKREEIRIAEEIVKSEQAERERLEREEFAKAQEELKRQQDELELQKQQAENARLEMERKEQIRIAEENKKVQEEQDNKFTERLSKLSGWSFNGFTVSDHGKIFGSKEDLLVLTHNEFVDIAANNEMYESTLLQIAEKKKQEEIEKATELALQKERERIEEENRLATVKREQEEQRKSEELAKAGDKANWEDYIAKIEAIKQPSFRSGQYRKIAAVAKEKVEEILNLKA